MTVGATFRGIVAWDKGRLKLCFRTLGSGERPTEIPTAPGEDEDLFVVVLEREEVAGRRPTEKDQTLLSTTQDGFRTDKAKLQGDWKLVGGEVNGEKIDVAGFGKLTIDGDRMILPEGEPCQVSFKLDTTKKPKQISLIIKSFGTASKDEGIYSLDGDDLKFCFPDKGKDATPPQDFVTKEGSGHRLFIFKRDKLSAAPTE